MILILAWNTYRLWKHISNIVKRVWGCELSRSGVSGCGEESTGICTLSMFRAKLLLPAALASAARSVRSVLRDRRAAFCSIFCTVGSLGSPWLTMNSWLSSCLSGLPNCWVYEFEPLACPALTVPECSPMLASLVHVCLFVESSF